MDQLAALIEVLPAGIACHDGEKIILANQAMCEITGYSREQLLAMNFWETGASAFPVLCSGSAANPAFAARRPPRVMK